jgi:uncharacterized membrane protein YkoI
MRKTWIASVALLAGGAVAGGILAGAMDANAATGSSSSSSSPPSQGGAPDGASSVGHGPGETLVTGTRAATLQAATLKAVPGGTVDRAETDSGDAAYEVHVTKSDGSQVTVKFDSSLNETGVESGMGK